MKETTLININGNININGKRLVNIKNDIPKKTIINHDNHVLLLAPILMGMDDEDVSNSEKLLLIGLSSEKFHQRSLDFPNP